MQHRQLCGTCVTWSGTKLWLMRSWRCSTSMRPPERMVRALLLRSYVMMRLDAEALFVKDLDKLEMILQAYEYEKGKFRVASHRITSHVLRQPRANRCSCRGSSIPRTVMTSTTSHYMHSPQRQARSSTRSCVRLQATLWLCEASNTPQVDMAFKMMIHQNTS